MRNLLFVINLRMIRVFSMTSDNRESTVRRNTRNNSVIEFNGSLLSVSPYNTGYTLIGWVGLQTTTISDNGLPEFGDPMNCQLF